MMDVVGPPHSGATHGWTVLGSVGKQTEQAMKTKPVSSTLPRPLPQFLSPSSCLGFLL